MQAISRGVPMLMIPFFGDQHRNAVRCVRGGYAKLLDFRSITTESIVEAVHEMTTNSSYAEKIIEISSIYSDNLVHPMMEAMFWCEYVMRHSGAKFLKSHAIQMSYFSYLLLDVLCANLMVLAMVVVLVIFLFRKCSRNTKNVSKVEATSKTKQQ